MKNESENKLYVVRPLLPPIEEYITHLRDIWSEKWLSNNGPKHNRFEIAVKRYLQADNLSLFVNGSQALDLAIKALNLRGEIITTPFTFAATTHIIHFNGIKPVFCDISLDDLNLDPELIEEKITPETTAILPVHIFGNPCKVDSLAKIAMKHDLKLLYDGAQAFGVELNGVPIGAYGDLCMFSLHATKVFHAIEGGILTYREPSLKKEFDLLKNFGIIAEGEIAAAGTNAKMNEFQAAMGLLNLEYIDTEIERRKEIVRLYRELLGQIEEIRFYNDIPGVKHNYNYFPVLISHNTLPLRDIVYERLKNYRIYAKKYYPLCHKFPYLNGQESLANAEYIAQRMLVLPLYGSLSERELRYIITSLKEIIHQAGAR